MMRRENMGLSIAAGRGNRKAVAAEIIAVADFSGDTNLLIGGENS
jgi:hypothetical protein